MGWWGETKKKIKREGKKILNKVDNELEDLPKHIKGLFSNGDQFSYEGEQPNSGEQNCQPPGVLGLDNNQD